MSVQTFDSRTDWLEARQVGFGIGASDVPKILLGDAFALWCEKTGKIAKEQWQDDEEEDDREVDPPQCPIVPVELGPRANDPAFWGVRLEAIVRETYCQLTRRDIEPNGYRIFRDNTRPWLFATPDGLIGTDGLYEGKTTTIFNAAKWKHGPPLAVQIQGQAQLSATRREYVGIAGLIGGQKLVAYDMQRNDSFIDAMLGELERFHECCVRDIPPTPSGNPSTKRALKLLHPHDNGETVQLPDDAIGMAIELDAIKSQQKDLQQRRDQIESRLKLWIGDASCGVAPDGTVWEWKHQTRIDPPRPESRTVVFRTLKKKGRKK